MGFQQTVLHRIQQKSRNLKNCWLMNCQKNYLRNCRSCLHRNCNQLYCQYQLHYHTHHIHNQKIHQKNHLQHFHLHHTEPLLRNYLRSELLPVLLQPLRPLPLPDVIASSSAAIRSASSCSISACCCSRRVRILSSLLLCVCDLILAISTVRTGYIQLILKVRLLSLIFFLHGLKISFLLLILIF